MNLGVLYWFKDWGLDNKNKRSESAGTGSFDVLFLAWGAGRHKGNPFVKGRELTGVSLELRILLIGLN